MLRVKRARVAGRVKMNRLLEQKPPHNTHKISLPPSLVSRAEIASDREGVTFTSTPIIITIHLGICMPLL